MHSYKNNISLRKESNMGIASLVLGIVSLVCGCFLPGLQWIGSIAGLIGIILGALGRKNSEKKGIATAPDWFVQSSVLCCLQFST